MCEQKWTWLRLKDGAVQENLGFEFLVWCVAEIKDVAIWAQAAEESGRRRRVNGLALGTDGDFAIITDSDAGLLAPDIGPPRTRRNRPQNGVFLGERLMACRLRGGAEFTMDFVLVGVNEELVEQTVGSFEFADLVGGEERREAFLPVVVAALDFAFGLGRGRVAEGDAVEV